MRRIASSLLYVGACSSYAERGSGCLLGWLGLGSPRSATGSGRALPAVATSSLPSLRAKRPRRSQARRAEGWRANETSDVAGRAGNDGRSVPRVRTFAGLSSPARSVINPLRDGCAPRRTGTGTLHQASGEPVTARRPLGVGEQRAAGREGLGEPGWNATRGRKRAFPTSPGNVQAMRAHLRRKSEGESRKSGFLVLPP